MPNTQANPTPAFQRAAPMRPQFEQELWDEMSNVVYQATSDTGATLALNATQDTTATIPCPAPARIEVNANHGYSITSPTAAKAAELRFLVDGAEVAQQGGINIRPRMQSSLAAGTFRGVLPGNWIVDVAAGVHTVTVRLVNISGADDILARECSVVVRRGRQPVQ